MGAAEGLGDDGGADGFAGVVVHAGFEALLAVAFEGVGGHGDDPGAALDGVLGAEAAGAFEAVHDGHLHVEEDYVVGVAGDGGEGFGAVEGVGGGVAEFLEEEAGDALVYGVVLDEEEAEGVAEGVGGVEGGGGLGGGRGGRGGGRRGGEEG